MNAVAPAAPGSWATTPFGSTRRTTLFIGGAWVEPLEARPALEVVDPATGRPAGWVPAAGAADVNRAVRAARRAFRDWAPGTPEVRAALLRALATRLEARSLELATLITAEMGAPLNNAGTQVRLAVEVIASYADLVEDFEWQEPRGSDLLVHEPAGVVAALTAWSHPLHLAVTKVAAALAAGCTVVLMPSEDAPLDAYFLAELFAEAAAETGVDPAVLAVVTGDALEVGDSLVTHPDVDVVSFAGPTELGGTSPAVVLADQPDGAHVAELATVVRAALDDVFLSSGRTGTAHTRLLVPSGVYDEAVAIAARTAEELLLGDPSEPGDHLGPVAGRRHYESVCRHIERGVAQGGRLVAGGAVPPGAGPAGFEDGYWIRPTVLADVDPASAIAREQVFGPVICLLPYPDETEALELANDSPYGLSGAVWCADGDRADAFALRLRTGSVTVNGAAVDPPAPAGVEHGLLEYLEVTSLPLPARRA